MTQSKSNQFLSPLKDCLVNPSTPDPIPFRITDAPTPPPVFASPLADDEIRQLLLDEANYDCDCPHLSRTPKRASYLSWDDYFMAVAHLGAHRSKDPNAPTGACIVDDDNRVVGIGYNGFPRGCSDDLLPWLNETDSTPFLHTPSPYECHAEVNAILNKCSADIVGDRMYVRHFPCNECAKMIAQSRIREVIYMRDDHHEDDVYRASRIILTMSGVTMRQYTPTETCVVLDLVNPDETTTTTTTTTPASVTPSPSDSKEAEYRDLLLKEADWTPCSTKRLDYVSWDDYFMAMAFLTAKRSKDPNTQVGACIVSPDQMILALGYNGFPRGCSDDSLPWARHADAAWLHKKYPYVCHAEVNAILNKCSSDVKHATLYVALFPCNECAKVIIQAGIQEVVYLQDHYHDTDMCRASRIMFGMAGVKLRQLVPAVQRVLINFDTKNDP